MLYVQDIHRANHACRYRGTSDPESGDVGREITHVDLEYFKHVLVAQFISIKFDQEIPSVIDRAELPI